MSGPVEIDTDELYDAEDYTGDGEDCPGCACFLSAPCGHCTGHVVDGPGGLTVDPRTGCEATL